MKYQKIIGVVFIVLAFMLQFSILMAYAETREVECYNSQSVFQPDDVMIDDILRAADSVNDLNISDSILMSCVNRIKTMKGLLLIAEKLYHEKCFIAMARCIERPDTIINASVEDVSRFRSRSRNFLYSNHIILACARRFRNSHDISLLMKEVLGDSAKRELAGMLADCAGVYGSASYDNGKSSQKLNDNLFAGDNKSRNIVTNNEFKASGVSNIVKGGNNINIKNSNADMRNFSGNQRSAMLFGNQIEDSADSVSVPGNKDGNKYEGLPIDQLVTMSEKELYQLLGKQLAELGYGLNYELKPIAGETFSYNSKQYYVLIPRTHLKSFINNCEYFKAVPVICNPSHVHEKLGKVGVVVEPKGSKMALDMIKNYNGRPLDKVVLIAVVLSNNLKAKETIMVEEKIEGDFKKCSGILNKMTKNPYGQRASMFRNIAKYYPGMLEKLPVTEIESNGKIYKQFEFPVVHLVLGAPDMNGKGKHVILSHEHYVYTLVKYLPKQIRK